MIMGGGFFYFSIYYRLTAIDFRFPPPLLSFDIFHSVGFSDILSIGFSEGAKAPSYITTSITRTHHIY